MGRNQPDSFSPSPPLYEEMLMSTRVSWVHMIAADVRQQVYSRVHVRILLVHLLLVTGVAVAAWPKVFSLRRAQMAAPFAWVIYTEAAVLTYLAFAYAARVLSTGSQLNVPDWVNYSGLRPWQVVLGKTAATCIYCGGLALTAAPALVLARSYSIVDSAAIWGSAITISLWITIGSLAGICISLAVFTRPMRFLTVLILYLLFGLGTIVAVAGIETTAGRSRLSEWIASANPLFSVHHLMAYGGNVISQVEARIPFLAVDTLAPAPAWLERLLPAYLAALWQNLATALALIPLLLVVSCFLALREVNKRSNQGSRFASDLGEPVPHRRDETY